MSKLLQNTRPAERTRGCFFSETFESNQTTIENGGALQANAFVDDTGLNLDGTGDYVSYFDDYRFSFGDGTSDNPFSITAWINMDDATSFPIFSKGVLDTDGEFAFYIDSSDKLVFRVFDESVSNCYLGRTYDTAIASDEGNWVLVAAVYDGDASSSTDLKIYLNGVQVDDTNSESNAGSYVAMENLSGELRVGRYDTDYADGKIKDLKIWKVELTAKEISDMYNKTTFTYEERAVIDLRMTMSQHDPTSARTLDRTSNSAHATFGDGATTSKYPTKLNTGKGYEFDGSDDYMSGTGTGLFNEANQSFVIEFYPDFAASDDVDAVLFVNTGQSEEFRKLNNASSNVLRIRMGTGSIASISEATYSTYWYQYRKNILIVTGDATNNLTNVWLNGVQILTDDSTTWTQQESAAWGLGSNLLGSSEFFDGKMTGFQFYNFLLNKTQIEDIIIKSNIRHSRF